MNKDILYVATSLFCSTDARVLTNEKQVNNLLDNSTNWQVFKVDKKTFKDLQKMAKESYIQQPNDWAFRRLQMSYKDKFYGTY